MSIKELSIDTKSILIGSLISVILVLINVPLLAWFFGPVVGAFISNFYKGEFKFKYSFMMGLDIGVIFIVFYLLYTIVIHGIPIGPVNWNSILSLIGLVLVRIVVAAIFGLIGGLIALLSIKLFNNNKSDNIEK
ncbi:MAG: hypothetical protein ACP5C3_03480 [Methanomicrobiales archaeon]